MASFVSKIFGLVLQAVSVPLAFRALGQHRYELYLLLSAALGSMSLTLAGSGPGLTQALAKASASGARATEAHLFAAASRIACAASVLGGSVVLAILYFLPPDLLFGPPFAHDRAQILHASYLCLSIFMAQMIFGVVDSALAGYQEQVLTFAGSAVANILTMLFLYLLCQHEPSIEAVILTLYGVPNAARALNLILLLYRRPYLAAGLLKSARDHYRTIMGVGLAFWLIQLGGILEQNAGVFIMAHLDSTHSTDLFAIAYRYVTLAGAVVIAVTQPLWPAVTDALAKRDAVWVQRAYSHVRRAATLYSCCIAIVIACFGQWLLGNLVHIDADGSWTFLAILAAYFIANTWTHVFYVILMGTERIWLVAMIVLGEDVLMALLGTIFAPRAGAAGMALSYLCASVAIPAWLLPRIMAKEVESMRRRATQWNASAG